MTDALFDDWQTIDTAPHDCGYVLLWGSLGHDLQPSMGAYVGMPSLFGRGAAIRGWWTTEGSALAVVTHWRRLPAPPVDA